MRRYKLAVHVLVILSVFNFVPVLAVPVPAQEVREACADVADGGENTIIVSGKRAEEGQGSWSRYHRLTQASPRSGSGSDQFSTSLQQPPGSLSTSDSTSGFHGETTNPTQRPSSASGDMRSPAYASGGTLPLHSSDTVLHSVTPGYGEIQTYQPGTTSKISPASSLGSESNKWEIGPATPSESSGEIKPATSSKTLPPPAQGEYHWSPPKKPKPQSKAASYWSKTKKLFSSMVDEMVHGMSSSQPKFKFRPRMSATASGAVNVAQRELQDIVHTEAHVSTPFISHKRSDVTVFLSVTL